MAIGFAAAFAGIMAISRTVLAAHWLTDTIGGACIGTGLALAWPAALEMARERHGRLKAGNASTRPNGLLQEDLL
jgi:membrane-associated phospholipid phosphatase